MVNPEFIYNPKTHHRSNQRKHKSNAKINYSKEKLLTLSANIAKFNKRYLTTFQ